MNHTTSEENRKLKQTRIRVCLLTSQAPCPSTKPVHFLCRVAYFFNTLEGEISWRPNFNRTRCPEKQVGHQTCRKQNPWLWAKQEKLKFTSLTVSQSWDSCPKKASDHEFTFRSTIEQTKKKHNALWPCTIHGHLLWPKHGAFAVRMHCSNVCLLRFTKAWILLGNISRLVCGTIKTMGHKTTRTVF